LKARSKRNETRWRWKGDRLERTTYQRKVQKGGKAQERGGSWRRDGLNVNNSVGGGRKLRSHEVKRNENLSKVSSHQTADYAGGTVQEIPSKSSQGGAEKEHFPLKGGNEEGER